jgi:hypothetical protein
VRLGDLHLFVCLVSAFFLFFVIVYFCYLCLCMDYVHVAFFSFSLMLLFGVIVDRCVNAFTVLRSNLLS